MDIAYYVVGMATSAWVGFSACALFTRMRFVTDALELFGVPTSWWNWLALAKAAGAVGVLVGFAIPIIGTAAIIGLILYFTGAVLTNLRAHAYVHTLGPVAYLVPITATLALQLAR